MLCTKLILRFHACLHGITMPELHYAFSKYPIAFLGGSRSTSFNCSYKKTRRNVRWTKLQARVIGLLTLLHENKALWHRLLLKVVGGMRLSKPGLPESAVHRKMSTVYHELKQFRKKRVQHSSTSCQAVHLSSWFTLVTATKALWKVRHSWNMATKKASNFENQNRRIRNPKKCMKQLSLLEFNWWCSCANMYS